MIRMCKRRKREEEKKKKYDNMHCVCMCMIQWRLFYRSKMSAYGVRVHLADESMPMNFKLVDFLGVPNRVYYISGLWTKANDESCVINGPLQRQITHIKIARSMQPLNSLNSQAFSSTLLFVYANIMTLIIKIVCVCFFFYKKEFIAKKVFHIWLAF